MTENSWHNISEFTKLLLHTNIDPLPYMSKIPPHYATGNSIESIIIPDNITSIGNNSFQDCDKLIKVIIPNSVVKIGNGVFYNCSSLNKIIFKGTKSQWRNIDKGAAWVINSPIEEIECTDGIISLK